jgi:hypothetical protein
MWITGEQCPYIVWTAPDDPLHCAPVSGLGFNGGGVPAALFVFIVFDIVVDDG